MIRDGTRGRTSDTARRRYWAPGRVNLLGDHTDYTGGLCLPMAIDLGTTVDFASDDAAMAVTLDSDVAPGRVAIPLNGGEDAIAALDGWSRYVAGVLATLDHPTGGTGTVSSDLPVGAGLSSSASLEVALALALGGDADPVDLALRCQRAEHLATGVPCGFMDQMAITCATEDHALFLDCHTLESEPVSIPSGTAVVVVDSGVHRSLGTVAYAQRRAECESAESAIGPLRSATPADAATIGDPVLRARARHVVRENALVRSMVRALRSGAPAEAGDIMIASHRSLAEDFEVSMPELDELVGTVCASAGVYGARLTGAGFGGCVVALVDAAEFDGVCALRAGGSWTVRCVGPAHEVTIA